MDSKTPIYLSDNDIERFKAFLEHYALFNLMLDRGVFNVKNGSVIMDFDRNSTLQTIRFTGFMYSKRHEAPDIAIVNAYYSL